MPREVNRRAVWIPVDQPEVRTELSQVGTSYWFAARDEAAAESMADALAAFGFGEVAACPTRRRHFLDGRRRGHRPPAPPRPRTLQWARQARDAVGAVIPDLLARWDMGVALVG